MSIISGLLQLRPLLSASNAVGAGAGLTFPALSPAESTVFELKDLNGQVHTLDQYKGQVYSLTLGNMVPAMSR